MTAPPSVNAWSPEYSDGTGRLPTRLSLPPAPHPGPAAGVWWPRTRRPAIELHGLAATLQARGVVATRLWLSVTEWDSTPGRLRLADRDVRLLWLAYQSPHTVTVWHLAGKITLVVVPPESSEESAIRAVNSMHSVTEPESLLNASTPATGT
jgi:hypothetical protein